MADTYSTAPQARGVHVVEIANYLLRHSKAIAIITLGFLAFVILMTLLRGADFVAESRFNPQAPTRPSQLSGLAAQLGVSVNGVPAGESVEFYAELVRSPDLLRQVVETRYAFPIDRLKRDTLRGTLVELYRSKGDTREERIRNAIAKLSTQVNADPEVKSGLVAVRTMARYPRLAVAINRRVLELVNDFNLKRRRSSASAEREFVEGRVNAAQRDLEKAERALRSFYDRNRQWQGSAQLVYEQARLQRQVDLANQVYLSLAQSYEQARIEEVRNTPVITVLDGPDNLVRRAGGNLMFNGVVGLFLGLVFGCAYAFAVEYLARERREEPAAFVELQTHLGKMRVRRKVRG